MLFLDELPGSTVSSQHTKIYGTMNRAAARRIGVRKTVAIYLIGERACIMKDSFGYCFEMLAAGTLIEGAELNVRRLPVLINCPQVGAELACKRANSYCRFRSSLRSP